MKSIFTDIRFGLRGLLKNPAFTAVADRVGGGDVDCVSGAGPTGDEGGSIEGTALRVKLSHG